jgi:molecular chaperone GrpE
MSESEKRQTAGAAPETDETQQSAAEPVVAGPPEEAENPEVELASLQSELDRAHDRALRLQAELENFRRRARREIDDERRYASMPLVRDLLPVIDNIHRAIEAAEKGGGDAGLLEGVKLMLQQLEGVLAAHHCQKIEALHQPFDPNLHEAILQQPSEDHPPGTVIMVTQAGYQLHDRVVRPAQVIVAAAES